MNTLESILIKLFALFVFWVTLSFLTQDMMFWYDNWLGRIVFIIVLWKVIFTDVNNL